LLARVLGAALQGIEALPVSVEVDLAPGLPALHLVGLPDAAVRESRDRVRSAIQNSGFVYPPRRITVNLAPAHLRKEGTALDLPVAVGILAATGALPADAAAGFLLAGELSLDGSLRGMKGALSFAIAAGRHGCRGLLIPEAAGREAACAGGVPVHPAASLRGVVEFLRGEAVLEPHPEVPYPGPRGEGGEVEAGADFAQVRGQAAARRAVEVAAAGGHNLLLVGPPGAGKTMLARRIPGILPPPSREEAIETTRVHSAAGLAGGGLLAARPFRAPHHSVTAAGLIGGGSHPRPGEASLAHNGVLFLDELPEFRRGALEALRQPLEEGRIVLNRAAHPVVFPARFTCVAAMNPCPCGQLGDPRRDCACTPFQVAAYRSRVSGPLLDRLDLHLEVGAVPSRELQQARDSESSAAIRVRVMRARGAQAARLAASGLRTNAEMGPGEVQRHCELDAAGRGLLADAVDRLGLSARAYDRIRKIARTLADLEGDPRILPRHVAEAIQYRSLDRTGAGLSGD
jgi:magnesium chelatase family protein